MPRLSLSELSSQASETPLAATCHAQLAGRVEKSTKSGKPYLELTFADATTSFSLKAWADHPQYSALHGMALGSALSLSGTFTKNQWGIDGSPWTTEPLSPEEADALLAGDPETMERQNADYADITAFIDGITDPRLHALCTHFLEKFGDRFRRTAAAKKNHHARRGGLVEHVAQMMRSANAIAGVYPQLNRDLLLAGVLFHDCGKLWENCYPESGFTQTQSLTGELIGHIPLGMELVNRLWRDLAMEPASEGWSGLQPASETVRLHLLHLIASHHGTHEFGSPTLPKTPEAHALHYVDNLDAKLEMVKDSYQTSNETIPGVYERQFPLPTNLVEPLPGFST
ncbi:MAG: HD domain-containing protein [Verrucomicrobiota bacterium JB023]|nr:HD domain-containing protein [Verrucomicrobiota bacterium JB023]